MEAVLCAANAEIQKYYFNTDFDRLPEEVKQKLQILCVEFTEDVGGVFLIRFSEGGTVQLSFEAVQDEIGAEVRIRRLQKEEETLWKQLELYYRVFVLGEKLELD